MRGAVVRPPVVQLLGCTTLEDTQNLAPGERGPAVWSDEMKGGYPRTLWRYLLGITTLSIGGLLLGFDTHASLMGHLTPGGYPDGVIRCCGWWWSLGDNKRSGFLRTVVPSRHLHRSN